MTPDSIQNGTLAAFTRWLVRLLTLAIVFFSINQIFNLNFFAGYTLLENRYLYALLACALPLVFIIYPSKNGAEKTSVPFYDWVLALAAFLSCGFFFLNGLDIVMNGWEMAPPDHTIWVSALLWFIAVEAGRRAGGISLAAVVIVISLYPIYAEHVPGPLAAFSSPWDLTAAYHAMSGESILGIPLKAFANLIIGFIIFGAALQHTGAGKFFIDFAFALLGNVRGGPAKVAILSSGLMGSMSGSVITNVLTTGPLTIPAMKSTGMSGTFAAGVETCASTGGTLMPPVMGATAFVMANLLGVPYADIVMAAIIPSLLYYYGLFVQIDAYAASNNLKGLERSRLPSVRSTLREGWYYLFAFGGLIFMLLVMKREMVAPYIATPILIIINQICSRKYRWGIKELLGFIDELGALFANMVAILAAVGLIIGALSVTGLAGTLVNELLTIAGGQPLLLLIMGAITGLILGIGMTSTAAYIFLAILLAPALISAGLDSIAVHMFIFYWGMLSFITPPVALGAFAAATVAGTPPMKTGLEAMRLGSVIYFIPFFFVFEPALVWQGPASGIPIPLINALLGIFFFASAIQGYVPFVGRLFGNNLQGRILRLLFLIAAITLALPEGGIEGLTTFHLTVFPIVALSVLLVMAFLYNKKNTVGTQA